MMWRTAAICFATRTGKWSARRRFPCAADRRDRSVGPTTTGSASSPNTAASVSALCLLRLMSAPLIQFATSTAIQTGLPSRLLRACRAPGSVAVRQDGEEGSRRARNSAPMSHRTSQSPISANRSGSVIGANTSVRRAAVSAPKRAAAMPAQERPLLVNTLFDPLFASFRKTLLASFPEPLLGPLGCPFDQRHPDLLQRPHRRHHRARWRHPLGDLPHPIDERALQLRRARIL